MTQSKRRSNSRLESRSSQAAMELNATLGSKSGRGEVPQTGREEVSQANVRRGEGPATCQGEVLLTKSNLRPNAGPTAQMCRSVVSILWRSPTVVAKAIA